MKNVFLVLCLMFSSMSVNAQLSAKVTVANNYVARGVSYYNGGVFSQSAGQPVVQGSLNYKMFDKELEVSMVTSPVDSLNHSTFTMEKDTEIDYIVNYSKQLTDLVNVGAWYQHYSFMTNEDNATNATGVNVMVAFVRLDWVQVPKFIGLDTSINYTAVSLFAPLSEKLVLQATFGRNAWGDETQIGMTDYSDQKFALRMKLNEQTEAEMAYTNTSGRKDLATGAEYNKDKAMTFSLTTEFPL